MITIIASAKLFWGFKIELPNEYSILTKNEQETLVTAEFKLRLKEFFKIHNMQLLMEETDKLKLHLHVPLIPDALVYACDHCHNYPSM